MPHDGQRWRAEYLHYQVRMWEETPGNFQLSVSDGMLTHSKWARNSDVQNARTVAARLTAAFARAEVERLDWVAEQPAEEPAESV